jgi:hypothetical protein
MDDFKDQRQHLNLKRLNYDNYNSIISRIYSFVLS